MRWNLDNRCGFRRSWVGRIICAIALLFVDAVFAQPTRIYLANDDHTDYLWTANGATYRRVFPEMIDYYLALSDATTTNASPYQSRFNCDGSFWLWTYEHERSPAEFARVMGRIRDGHLSAPLTTLVSCYGGQPAEAVLRGMYYAGHLERRFDHRFTLAVAMENQSLPLGLATLWAGAGARYSWRGICGCASHLPGNLGQRAHEIYWYTGLDGKRVLMKWHSLANGDNKSIGGYAEAYDPVASVKYLDADPGFLGRYTDPAVSGPYRVRGAFGFGWDALARKTGTNISGFPYADHFHEVARAQSNADRQVFASNEEDFFRDFEESYGAHLPSETVTYGNEWELLSASMAETSARVKRAVEKLRAAEALSTLVSLQQPGFLRGREGVRDRAFVNLGLYWEHDWTADGPVSRDVRAAWQEQLAAEIESYVDTLHQDAADRLGTLIANPNRKRRFYVFNPLGWTRSDAADLPYTGPTDIHVHDLSSDRDVPHQFQARGGTNILRILAGDLPPVGYKVFEIRAGPGAAPTEPAATVSADHARLDNGIVNLKLDPDGAIASFSDKSQGAAELAATIDGLKLNDLVADDTEGSALSVEDSGPVSVTVKCVSTAGKAHTTRITLYAGSRRVDIRNEITENFSDVRHWAFSFNLTSPEVHTEEVGAVILAKRQSDGGHYSDNLARYDYLTVNHFADLTDGTNTRGVTLANADCAFARFGRSSATNLDTATPQLGLLAGGQVDGPGLGIKNQNGATNFLQRFSLRAHGAYDQVAAMKFGLECQNPPVTGLVTGDGRSPYPANRFTLLSIDNPNVLLWALKPHDDGVEQGIVARLWNQSDTPGRFVLSVASGPLTLARRLTHVETALDDLPTTNGVLRDTLPAQGFGTYGFALRRSGFATRPQSKSGVVRRNSGTELPLADTKL